MFETKFDIKSKIESLKEYAHIFTYTRDEVEIPLDYENVLVSIIEHERTSHFIYFLNHEHRIIDGEERLFYKEYSLKTDRLYYLEIANTTISPKKRIEFILSIIGRRKFGSNNDTINIFVKNRDISLKDIYKAITDWEKNPLKDAKDSIIYEHDDKNINYFEALLIENSGKFFAFMTQRNYSRGKCVKKSFLVEVGEETLDILRSGLKSSFKIERIFMEIGKSVFLDGIEKQSRQSSGSNVSTSEIGAGEKSDDYAKYDRLFTIREKETIKIESLKDAYFELYGALLNFVKSPTQEGLGSGVAKSILNYKDILKDEPLFDEIVALLVSTIVLFEDGDFGILVEKDRSFKEILITSIESIGSWQNDMFSKKDVTNTDLAAATIDFIENLKYIIKSFDDRRDMITDNPYTSCNEDEELFFTFESFDEQHSHEAEREKISSEELFKIAMIETELIDELNDLENELSDIFYLHDALDAELISSMKRLFGAYATMLNTIYEFRDIGYALSSMVATLEHLKIENVGEDIANYLYQMLKSLSSDLMVWKSSVLVKKEADDIHYLDATFLANIKQIEIMLAS